MAYGEPNGHVLDDVTCPVYLLGTDKGYLLRAPCQNVNVLLSNIYFCCL